MNKELFLVTGGSGGIGVAICDILAKNGYIPLVTFRENDTKAIDIAEKVNGIPLKLDLLNLASIDEIADDISKLEGSLAGVILGASPPLVISPFGQISENDMEMQWRTNVLGNQRLLAQLIRKNFKKKKSGIILGILSEAMGNSKQAEMSLMGSYITAKYGLQGLLSVVKKEFNWLDVTSIKPGFTDTRMLTNAFDSRFLEPLRNAGKISTPEKIAEDIMAKIIDIKNTHSKS